MDAAREAPQGDGVNVDSRRRTVLWEDPHQLAASAEGRSGLDFLRAVATGQLPPAPFFDVVGIRLVEVDEGRVVFESEIGEHQYNLIGSVHGGFAASIIDSATGCAVYSTIGVGDRWTTLDLGVDYLRPLDVDTGLVRCEAQVVTVGRRIGIADAVVKRSRDGKVVARGRTRCMIFRARE